MGIFNDPRFRFTSVVDQCEASSSIGGQQRFWSLRASGMVSKTQRFLQRRMRGPARLTLLRYHRYKLLDK